MSKVGFKSRLLSIFKLVVFLSVTVLLTLTGYASSETVNGETNYSKICLKHKTRGTIKTNCSKSLGRHDASYRYYCYDSKKGQDKEFYLDQGWQPLSVKHLDCSSTSKVSKGKDPIKGFTEKDLGDANE